MTEVAGSGRLHRGSSGATIRRFSTQVVKKGDLRVADQGQWIADHRCDVLPQIFGVTRSNNDRVGEYQMETLTPLPIDLLDVHTTLLEIFRRLEEHIWSKSAESVFSQTEHHKKLDALKPYISPREQNLLWQLEHSVDWGDLQYCLTHGDPTIDNAMLRQGELVLVDPIPSTPAIPDFRAVDLGKMIQSYTGYEMYRYQLNGPRHGEHLSEFLRMICVDTNERAAALYFAVVHFVRAHPYLDSDTNRRLREFCLPIIEEAASEWTR